MKSNRFQDLLEHLLDEELSTGEADELAAMISAQPELRRDLRQHLILWDAWSQQVAAERSEEAFVEAWKTRVRAEEGGEKFSASVLDRIRESAGVVRAVPFWKRWARPWPVAFALFALMFVAVAAWWTQSPSPEQGRITVSGEGVCTRCVLELTAVPGPALRMIKNGTTNIVFLNYSHYSQALHIYFSGGTIVTAQGILRTNDNRVILDTDSIKVGGVEIR